MRTDLRILLEAYINKLEGNNFQDFCDRLFLKVYPDYQTVKAGGRNGDLKNDGYCFMSKMFFAAYAPEKYIAKKNY